MQYDNIHFERINLQNSDEYNLWQDFLKSSGITNFSDKEVSGLDETYCGFNENNKIVATGSLQNNILKYLAVSSEYRGEGSLFNQMVSHLTQRLFLRGINHWLVFTKPMYRKSFSSTGFHVLAETNNGLLLEGGMSGIEDYLDSLPKPDISTNANISSIVMNANPFTRGHKALVKEASTQSDYVYVFVVSEDASLFNTNERFQLVKEGCRDFDNVLVVPGKEYMVSYATFPSYFLSSNDEMIKFQTELDADLFKKQIAPKLKITTRYLGDEPFSHTTGIYNQTLSKILPPEVNVKIVDRKTNVDGEIITATEVRKLIKEDQLEQISKFVPETTFNFIKENKIMLQDRIKKGMKISGN